MIAYRDGTAADAAAIDALYRISFTATFGQLYDPADLAAFLGKSTLAAWQAELDDPDIAVRLVEHGDALLGFAKVGPVTLPVVPAGPAVELRQLYLSDEAKGSGMGQALMDWTMQTARERGAGELFLSVFVDNHRARRFYQRQGFVDIGPYRFAVGNHLDEDRLMRLRL